MTRQESEIIWQCLLDEIGHGEGCVVAEALMRAATSLGLTPEDGMAAYDSIPISGAKGEHNNANTHVG